MNEKQNIQEKQDAALSRKIARKQKPLSLKQRIARSPFLQKLICDMYSRAGRAHARDYDISQSIIISGCPRSGTNWLSETLHRITDSIVLEEPDNILAIPEVKQRLQLTWRPYRNPHHEDIELTKFLRDMFTGNYLNPSWVKRDVETLRGLREGKPFIVRFVRMNLLLPFIHRTIPEVKIIQILRNPYSVVASQLLHGDWLATKPKEYWKTLYPDYPEFELPFTPSTREEILAMNWCLEFAFLEKNMSLLEGVHVIRYEDLFHNREEILRGIVNYLGIPWREEYVGFLDKKSKSVMPGSAVLQSGDATKNYEHSLDQHQLDNINKVLHHFKYPFYKPEQ